MCVPCRQTGEDQGLFVGVVRRRSRPSCSRKLLTMPREISSWMAKTSVNSRSNFPDHSGKSSRTRTNWALIRNCWSFEPNAFNHDLTKPALLAPLIGEKGLRAPTARMGTFSPTLGFAWTATSDAKTVLRGGVGRYFDPAHRANVTNRANERWLLLPLGTGRLNVSGSNILWNGRQLAG